MSQQPILLDTNILSIFAELQDLDLLLTVLDKHRLYISPAVHQELLVGLTRGHTFLQPILDLIGESRSIPIVSLTLDESGAIKSLPTSLASGEAESIVVCRSRGWIFASYDRKAVNYCKHNNILTLTLNDILAALWRGKVVSKEEVKEIIRKLESGGRVIRAKAEILKG